MAEKPESDSAQDRARWTFGLLLSWHLRRGTRPGGSPERPGRRWAISRLAEETGLNDRTVRYWLNDRFTPIDIDTIERVLFGAVPSDPRQVDVYAEWRLELRDSHARRPTVPPPDKTSPPSQPTSSLSSTMPIQTAGPDEVAFRQADIVGIDDSPVDPLARPPFPESAHQVWPKILPAPGSAGFSQTNAGRSAPFVHTSSLEQHSEHVEEPRIRRLTSTTIRSGCFEANAESHKAGNCLKYTVKADQEFLRFSDVFDLWSDVGFVDFYMSLFKQSGYYGYAWETPAISIASVDRKFEFVIHKLPKSSGNPDRTTYARYFDKTAPDGVVSFKNLGGDALLIVPSPFRQDSDYSGMVEFYRDAPIAQQRALWRELGRHAKSRLCDRPIWLSVAGGGIQWLHIRIDSDPKYYRYMPYTEE